MHLVGTFAFVIVLVSLLLIGFLNVARDLLSRNVFEPPSCASEENLEQIAHESSHVRSALSDAGEIRTHRLTHAAELIKHFKLEKVVKSPAAFDYDKLQWLNGHYIRESSQEEIYQLCLEYLWEC